MDLHLVTLVHGSTEEDNRQSEQSARFSNYVTALSNGKTRPIETEINKIGYIVTVRLQNHNTQKYTYRLLN